MTLFKIWAKTSLNSYISLEASFNLFCCSPSVRDICIVISFTKKMNSGKISNEWKGREQKEKKHKRKKKLFVSKGTYPLSCRYGSWINVILLFRWPGIFFIEVRNQETDNTP